MRNLGLGLGLTRGGAGVSAPFTISPTGLSTDSLGTYAQVGDHAGIGYTINPDTGTETVKWSNSSDPAAAATYGTGASPTDYTAGDEGNLWLHVTDGGETVSRSVAIRRAPGTLSIADQSAWTVDDTSVNLDASASGANLTFTYAATGLASGLSINASSGAITGTLDTAQSGTATVTATDQYGRTLQDTFTWSAVLRTQATAADGLGPFSWTVDDTTVNVDATTDFTANGNTLTYTATGLPAGVTIATNGIISGTPTAASSGSIVITGQDEYGRETTSTTSHTTALRAQATGGTDLDLSFPEGSAITSTDLLQNWTANGNTLSFVSVSPSLPAGLSINSSGVLSGTPTTVTADATYTLTMQDEYGRQTSDTFTLEITEGFALQPTADGELEIDGATGTVTVTITSPSWYANYDAGNGPGVFTFDSTLLASGPVNIIPPLIERTTDADSSGTTNAGDTVGIGAPASTTSYPGLWVYDPDVGGLGTASYQWQADAGGDGNFADLSGAASSTYTLTSGEAGDDVRAQETLADNGGSRTVSSVAISVEAASPSSSYSDSFDLASGTEITANDWAYVSSMSSNPQRITHNGSGALQNTDGTGAELTAIYSGSLTFSDDQYAEIVIDNIGANFLDNPGCVVRMDSLGNGYSVKKVKTDELRVYSVSSGTTTELDRVTTTIANGDTLRLEAEGTTIRVLVNGVEEWSATNTDHATGEPGVYFTASNGTPQIGSAAVGDISGA